MKIRRLIYKSQAILPFNKRKLLDLLHESRSYNSIDCITGLLMHKEGFFLQVFEGEPSVIENLLNRILNDTRHTKIEVVQDCTANNRLFSTWAMGCLDFDEPELSLLPGIRTDLSDPIIIQELISQLPEISNFLLHK
jgi:hypothetical protein